MIQFYVVISGSFTISEGVIFQIAFQIMRLPLLREWLHEAYLVILLLYYMIIVRQIVLLASKDDQQLMLIRRHVICRER